MGLVGNIRDLKLPNLIQINCMEKNVAKLIIENRNRFGSVYFANGQIVHAEFNDMIGEDAVHAMLRLREGIFKVEGDVAAPAITIKSNWSNILLEGMRLIDEDTESADRLNENTIEDLTAIRGIEEAIILSPMGEVSAASIGFDQNITPNLNYVFFKIDRIEKLLQNGIPSGLMINIGKKYYLTKMGSHFLGLQLEDKTQIDIILPMIKQLVSQKSAAF